MKWKRKIPSQRGRLSGINIIDANTPGPIQLLVESPLEAFSACIDIVVRYTSQKYE